MVDILYKYKTICYNEHNFFVCLVLCIFAVLVLNNLEITMSVLFLISKMQILSVSVEFQ